ncbi:VOC family protein [Xanthomonas vesicatoria]|uniref:VOC family protein n=1 Tax=Xanthomonas vesicatoria TaxID=56460 RepID=UPI001E4B406E|nr:VOC family protein [Xanthomonas vesicatoria]MCC8617095.1 glyoxalase/bleomycin resistance/dioxygenase family protein [Xanthomonas vesicatoria]MCC8630996.1 glyoxalase/bleomycin resistance/dioxygenase family protein [Xanthomonas vesicatoria]
MSGPARAGLFIYAKDLPRLAGFYESFLGMSRSHTTPDLVVLCSPDIQLIVHSMPPAIAAAITISDPPAKRDNAALKFFFTVPSLVQARNIASSLGGEVLQKQWQGPGFTVCNAVDPEGNIFQVRESAP